MTPSEFAAKWTGSTQTERAASQEHFIGLCQMLGSPTPNEPDPTGDWYAFEKGAEKGHPASMHGCLLEIQEWDWAPEGS